MGSSHLLYLYYTSSRALRIRRFCTYFPTRIIIIRRNTQGSKESNGHGGERAPTTAQEFERVAEEFERNAEAKAQQGFASQTTEKEKAHDGTGEAAATPGGSKVESVKEKYGEPVGRGYFHKTGSE